MNGITTLPKAILKTIIAAIALSAAFTGAAHAGKKDKAERLVTRAEASVKDFVADPEMSWLRDNMSKAKAVIIVPQSVKGGFIWGGSGGNGVLLAKSAKDDGWTSPAFYTLGSVTFGLQIGAEVAEIILLVMTDRGKERVINSSLKLGADASIAAGPVGAGAKAQTADILAFSRAKGVYGGINLEGAVIKQRDAWNEAYYGQAVRPSDIILRENVANTQAASLKSALSTLASQ